MMFKVLLFATLKDMIGKTEIVVEQNEPISIKELMTSIFLQHPQLIPFENRVLVAINHDYASPDQLVYYHDEIAIFPPVSGG